MLFRLLYIKGVQGLKDYVDRFKQVLKFETKYYTQLERLECFISHISTILSYSRATFLRKLISIDRTAKQLEKFFSSVILFRITNLRHLLFNTYITV